MYKYDLLVTTKEQLLVVIENVNRLAGSRIYIELGAYIKNRELLSLLPDSVDIFLCGPYVLRNDSQKLFESTLDDFDFKGILVRNADTLGFLNSHHDKYKSKILVLDNSFYIFNHSAFELINDSTYFDISEFYFSYELNEREQKGLYLSIREKNLGVISSNTIYGRIPMMISANCVKKTLSSCNQKREFVNIYDRMNKEFVTLTDCYYCYNVILNSVPIALNKDREKLSKMGRLRINFTCEDKELTGKLLDYYFCDGSEFPIKEYTTGHFRRGVE